MVTDNLKLDILKSLDEIESIRSTWERMQADESYPKTNADIDRYLCVMEASSEPVQPYIMVVKEDEKPTAIVIGKLESSPLKCMVGRATLWKPVLKQLTIVYGGIIGKAADEIYSFIIDQLMKLLRRHEADVIMLNHIGTDGPLYEFARKIPGVLCRGYFPKVEPHWCRTIPDDMDVFYKSLSGKHRGNLRNYTRKLERAHPDQVKVVTYTQEEELDTAITAASEISAKTYQRAFGGGVVDNTRTRKFLSKAAKEGWLNISVLYINEQPSAFQMGLKYQSIYFAEEMGYDPSWKKFRIGTILFLKVLEELCNDPTSGYFDFSWGNQVHKTLYGNKRWNEASVYIFAPRFFPIVVNLVRSLTDGISGLVHWLVSKLGILNLVQRYRRRLALQKAEKPKNEVLNSEGSSYIQPSTNNKWF
ncbi:MAG: GNAT family N-acetyltransferase [Planctomycetota bacterium]